MGGQVPVRPDRHRERAAVRARPASCAPSAWRAPKRLPSLPDVPTLAEQGLAGFEAYAWQGLVVPAATPPTTVARSTRRSSDALNSTAVKARFQALGVGGAARHAGPDGQYYAKSERERWGKLIKANNIKLD